MKRQLICTKCKQWFYPDGFGRISQHNCKPNNDADSNGRNNITSTVYDDFIPSNYDSNIDTSSSSDTSSSDIGGGGDFGGAGCSGDY